MYILKYGTFQQKLNLVKKRKLPARTKRIKTSKLPSRGTVKQWLPRASASYGNTRWIWKGLGVQNYSKLQKVVFIEFTKNTGFGECLAKSQWNGGDFLLWKLSNYFVHLVTYYEDDILLIFFETVKLGSMGILEQRNVTFLLERTKKRLQ